MALLVPVAIAPAQPGGAPPDAPIAAALASVDDDARAIHQHTAVLASPFFEGRGMGTRGLELAGEYLEFHLRVLGLEPAFEDPRGEPTFRQPVVWERDVERRATDLAVSPRGESPGTQRMVASADFEMLPVSGEGSVTAEAVFVGYSIVIGPGGYMTYRDTNSLEGRIAIVLDYEPMEDGAQSQWTRRGWSDNANLAYKISAAVRRRAAGVIVVTPTPALPDRERPLVGPADRLERVPEFEGVPVVVATPDAVDRLIRASDPEGRSFDDLVALANTSAEIVDLPGARITLAVGETADEQISPNIGAVLPGRGALADEYVVIGAHYDHLGDGSRGSRSPNRAGEVHPGADDNASGTASVLVIADRLASAIADDRTDRPRRSVLFLFFTAEEIGLIGSQHYVRDPIAPIDQHTLMLNMDMIGRMFDDRVQVGGLDRSDGLEAFADPMLDASGLDVARSLTVGWDRSDHASFAAEGVPALFFFTGLHSDYHTAEDTIDELNRVGTARVARLASEIAHAAAYHVERFGPPTDPDRRGVTDPARRARPSIGVVPLGIDGRGARVRRVRDDSPASNAGLQRGDLIVAWNGEPIRSLEDYASQLGRTEGGDRVTLTIERAGEQMQIEVEVQQP